jgi:hypothetical protein
MSLAHEFWTALIALGAITFILEVSRHRMLKQYALENGLLDPSTNVLTSAAEERTIRHLRSTSVGSRHRLLKALSVTSWIGFRTLLEFWP